QSTWSLYDPSANSWSSLTSNSTLGARSFHTANLVTVSGGATKVLVLGGTNTIPNTASTLWTTGALYDPSPNSRSATAVTQPAKLMAHNAITQSDGKVIVGGGRDGTNYLTTGYLYDGVAGTWTTTGSLASTTSWGAGAQLANGYGIVVGGYN